MLRKDWLSLLARTPPADLEALWERAPASLKAPIDWLRAPESGAVMVRGRAGAVGAPFNLGEMTVTRCTLRAADGVVGHGYVQGRDKTHAERIARLDAALQGEQATEIMEIILDPLCKAKADRQAKRAARAAATKVDFFTLVRGE